MKKLSIFSFFIIFSSVLVTLFPSVATASPNGDNVQCLDAAPIVGTGVVNAGEIRFCLSYDSEVNIAQDINLSPGFSNGRISAHAFGPSIPSLSLITYTWTATGFTASSGCTISAFTPVTTAGTFGSSSNWDSSFSINTFTTNHCRGAIRLVVAAGVIPVTIYDQSFAVNVNVINNYQFNFHCAATSGLTKSFNSSITPCNTATETHLTYLCAASGTTPNAFNPATNTCNTPTINTVVSGSLTLAGTINVVNSGGQNIAITSWPTLNAALSGGLSITFANGLTVTSTNALSGTINVVNSGGQTIAISSWPELMATLGGELNVRCLEDTCKSNINVDNLTANTNSTSNITLDIIPPLLILAAIAFFVVMAESRKDALYWFFATILSIYLLIIRSNDSVIPVGVYVGWIFVCLYQAVAILMNKRAERLDGNDE